MQDEKQTDGAVEFGASGSIETEISGIETIRALEERKLSSISDTAAENTFRMQSNYDRDRNVFLK